MLSAAGSLEGAASGSRPTAEGPPPAAAAPSLPAPQQQEAEPLQKDSEDQAVEEESEHLSEELWERTDCERSYGSDESENLDSDASEEDVLVPQEIQELAAVEPPLPLRREEAASAADAPGEVPPPAPDAAASSSNPPPWSPPGATSAASAASIASSRLGPGGVDSVVAAAAAAALTQASAGDADGSPAETAPPSLSSLQQHLPLCTGISIPMLLHAPTFIRTVPESPEPLYNVPEALFDDIVRQEADRISHPSLVQNRIVYDSFEAPAGSTRPTAAGFVEDLPPFYTPTGTEDHTLVFESRFESGNLRRAVQVYDYEYDLILNPDYNTKVHTQWFLFRVTNTRKGPQYRFNIINMIKPTSVYNEGMRPLVYSRIEAADRRIGWVRGTQNIAYYQNGIRRKHTMGSTDKCTNYYTLTFTVEFQHDCDSVFFAPCYPYTYSDLQKDLQRFESDPVTARLFRRRKLCETLAGNTCDLVTITSFNSDPAALRSRRAVVITARVHPGESNASWVMKGMLDYLTGNSLDARILRDNFVFKIIPMLNPDGVIVGNYRCSLAGTDLNRQWGDPSRKLHPTIFFAKSMMRHLIDDREVVLYVDIHGHSRKKNVFMYGNNCESSSIREKIFPRLLSKSSDCFNFDECCFKIQKSKETTARVVAYKELSISSSFTLEASFCGADQGALSEQHFTTRHFEEMGYMVCDGILDFCDPDQSKVALVCKELQQLFPDDGNSDDVSDSEVDEATQRVRRRKRPPRKKQGQRELTAAAKEKEKEKEREKERKQQQQQQPPPRRKPKAQAQPLSHNSRQAPQHSAPQHPPLEPYKTVAVLDLGEAIGVNLAEGVRERLVASAPESSIAALPGVVPDGEGRWALGMSTHGRGPSAASGSADAAPGRLDGAGGEGRGRRSPKKKRGSKEVKAPIGAVGGVSGPAVTRPGGAAAGAAMASSAREVVRTQVAMAAGTIAASIRSSVGTNGTASNGNGSSGHHDAGNPVCIGIGGRTLRINSGRSKPVGGPGCLSESPRGRTSGYGGRATGAVGSRAATGSAQAPDLDTHDTGRRSRAARAAAGHY